MTQKSDGAQTPALRSDTSPTIAKTAAGVLAPQPVAERCDHCGAPVDGAQRYCVQCGAHQRSANDPTARWFASARRAKATAALPPAAVAGGTGGGRTIPAGVAALLIALLPLSAGVGVVVGRNSDDSGKQVVEALKAVGAGGAAGAGAAAAGATTANAATTDDSTAASKSKDSTSGKKVDGVETSTKEAPIIGNGAHQLAGSKPTAEDLAKSKQAVKDINSKKGSDYVKAQADLPDTITVP